MSGLKFAFLQLNGEFLDSQGWHVSHSGNDCTRMVPIACDGEVVALVVAKGEFGHEMDAQAEDCAAMIVSRLNAHDTLVKALDALQRNPNDPRAHREAFDALKMVGAA